MKNRGQISFIVGLSVLGLCGVYLILSAVSGDILGSLVNQRQAHYDGSVKNTIHDVRLRSRRDISWKDVSVQTGLNFGDQIFVGSQSSAEVQLDGMGLRLSENSLFEMEKSSQSSELHLSYGKLNINLDQQKTVALKIGQEQIQINGQGTELLVNRSKDSKEEHLGLSALKGSASISTASGEKLEAGKDGFLMLTARPGQKIEVQKFALSAQPLSRKFFLQKQKARFAGKIDSQLSDVMMEISSDEKFEKVVSTKSIKEGQDFCEQEVPAEPGRYFWRLRGRTESGLIMPTSSEAFYVVDLRPLKVLNPFLKFQRPGVWSADLVLEEIDQAESYEIQISKSPEFSDVFMAKKSKSATVRLDFARSGDYFVRARYRFPVLETLPHWSEIVALKVPEPPPVQITSPSYQFVKPGVWAVEFNLQNIDQNEGYEVQFSKDANFSKTFQDLISQTSHVRMEIPEHGKIFLRTKYKFRPELSQPVWSEAVSTNIPPPPIPPQIVGSRSRANKISLKWTSESPFTTYQIRVSDSEKFSQAKVLAQSDNLIEIPAKVDKFQYAQVAGYMKDGQYSEWSETYLIPAVIDKIKVNDLAMLRKKIPRVDPHSKNQLKVSWDNVDFLKKEKDLKFLVELSDNVELTKPLQRSLASTETTFDLENLKPMYFRIRPAADARKYWTEASDTLEILPPAMPGLEEPVVTFPRNHEMILLSPGNAQSEKSHLYLSWKSAKGAEGYEVQMATDKEFNKVVSKEEVKETHLQIPKAIPKGVYFWRIRSFHSWAESAWSNTQEFKVIYEQTK